MSNYYGRNNYAAGDNYGRAGNYAYAAGGIGSFLKGVAGTIAGAIPVVGSSLQRAIVGVPKPQLQLPVQFAPGGPQQIPVPATFPGAVPKPGAMGTLERILPGGASGYVLGTKKKRRPINPLNVKALRRANRRVDGFIKTVRRSLKHTAYSIHRRGTGGRGGSRGVITRSEAAKALRR